MARTESRTKTDIWNNEDFRALTRNAQRLYWLIYSQPTISLCGVVAYTPGRWARLSSDDTVEDIRTAMGELEVERFIVTDLDTEEVFVRSFMRNDGVWRSPKTQGAARDQSKAVMSRGMREAISVEMRRLDDGDTDTAPDALPDRGPDTPSTGTNEGSDGVSDTGHDRTRAGAHASSNSFSDSVLRPCSPNDDESRVTTTGVHDSGSSSSWQSHEGPAPIAASLSKVGLR